MVSKQAALTKVFGDPQKRAVKKLEKRVEEVNKLAGKYKKMTKPELRKQTEVLRKRLEKKGVTLDTILPDAFALVREMSDRVIGERHYDVQLMGAMVLEEKYSIDREHECRQVFRTVDSAHPGVQMVLEQGEVNLAGPVQVFSQGEFPAAYPGIYMTPAETRALFERNGWTTVAAFQTRNPMHRSHEYLAKIAIEICDGVLVHSLLGKLKPGDIPAAVRQEAIGVLIDNYFVKNTVVQSGYPLDMRYAGPREALLHALFRQNYGCSHLIVGRDHAGVGDYYGPFDSHRIFDEIPGDALLIEPMRVDWTFWCHKCEAMASARTCPHDDADRLLVSGTKLRSWLSEGSAVPPQFSRPEVLEILRSYYASLDAHENVKVELKGHSAR